MASPSPSPASQPARGRPSTQGHRNAVLSRLMAGERPALEAVDRLVELAARLLDARCAQLSLVGDRHVIASVHGQVPARDHREGALELALAGMVVARGAPLMIADARADELVAQLAPTVDSFVGSYLGVPLRVSADGLAGALCVFDPEPRAWSDDDLVALEQLAASIGAELELAAISEQLTASTAQLELGFAAANIGSFDWDLVSDELRWDTRLVELFGYDHATFDHHIDSFFRRVHPDDVARVTEAVQAAVRSCGEYIAEYRIVLPDGTTKWVNARGRVLCDGNGRAARMLGAAYDDTESRSAREEVARVLEWMGNAFLSVAADWRITYVNAQAERMLRRRREELVGVELWKAFPEVLGSRFEECYRSAMATGGPVTFEDYYEPVDTWFEVQAWPMPEGLSIFFDDVTARRRAEQQVVRALEEAERANARLTVLADAGARLADSLEPRTVVATLSELVVPNLAPWAVLAVREDVAVALGEVPAPPDAERIHVIDVAHADATAVGALTELFRHCPLSLDDRTGVGHVIRRGVAEWLPAVPSAVAESPLLDARQREVLHDAQACRALSAPLTSRGRTLGALTVAEPAPGQLDQRLVLALASRAAAALDNAILFGATRRLALTLQRSLLPDGPPTVDGVEIAVRYVPGVNGTEVGGDFYLARKLDDERLLLAIGDVVGSGVEAAARMGQLRSVIATLAYDGDPVDLVLARLAERAGHLLDLPFATLLLAHYHVGSRRLVGASAGHPPPLLSVEGQRPEYLSVKPGPPLGVGRGTYPAFTCTLPPGSALLLYTDGLVEERGRSIDVGLEHLRAVAPGPQVGPEQFCDRVLSTLSRSRGTDDIAMLLLRHL